jgi:hypothetical protein
LRCRDKYFVGGRSVASGSYTIAQCGTIEKDIVTEEKSLNGQRTSEKKKKIKWKKIKGSIGQKIGKIMKKIKCEYIKGRSGVKCRRLSV